MFIHNLVTLPKLAVDTNPLTGRRHYVLPSGKPVPSVTTILDVAAAKSPVLLKWKQRMGEKEANKFAKMMATRGKNLHKICENYLQNMENPSKGFMPDVRAMFAKVKKELDNINNLRCIEGTVYSEKYEFAGTSDTIAEWIRKLSIIDFKTTNSDKEISIEKTDTYFIQEGGYAIAFEEMFGIPVNHGVIIFASNDYGPMVVEKELTPYKEKFINLRKVYQQCVMEN